MRIEQNEIYLDDLKNIIDSNLPWEKLSGKGLLMSGATGMIGSCLVDAVMMKNRRDGLGCRIYAVSRNAERARLRFGCYWDSQNFKFMQRDINEPFEYDTPDISFVLHLAGNTHPVAYSRDPVGTIMTNIVGTDNLLKFALRKKASRFLFASSVEVYGENRGDVEKFSEDYLGYIDCNTMRANYPESKRCGEALCRAYGTYGLDVVTARLSRIYGPTMLKSDSKALSQFIKKAVAGEDIVLKSEGNQFYSYTYVADAVTAILKILLEGQNGEAYNVADEKSDITLKDLAGLIAKIAGKKVIFELPDEKEAAGYSKATKAVLDPGKIKKLGWTAKYDIEKGVGNTIDILKTIW